MKVYVLLFDAFETLDVFGPVEILGQAAGYELSYCSIEGKMVKSAQGCMIQTERLDEMEPDQILLVPGGRGTRALVSNEAFLKQLGKAASQSSYCLSVCTGSALLAAAKVLDGRKATSNKISFSWVCSISSKVNWINRARWVKDDTFYSSSGVSAGIDMTLGFIADREGREAAKKIADHIEYLWNEDSDNDPFAHIEEKGEKIK